LGYRNSWGVILCNLGEAPFTVMNGDRIAQAVLSRVEKVEWKQVEVLPESERSLGGFGHYGVK
jgi:dUTP pyrophosphatase